MSACLLTLIMFLKNMKRDLPAGGKEPAAKKAKAGDDKHSDGNGTVTMPDPEKTAAMIAEKKREIALRIQRMREAKAAEQQQAPPVASKPTPSVSATPNALPSNPLVPRVQFATVKVPIFWSKLRLILFRQT